MSSTQRGGQRSEADFYATPAWPVHRLLERLKLPGGIWLEPAAGEGHIIRAVNIHRVRRAGFYDDNDVSWRACEIREECRSKLEPFPTIIGDFLSLDLPGRADVLITNPPFSLAQEFIEAGLKCADYAVFLLRLNFLGTARRNSFFQSTMPDVYVVPDRISFTADGKADSIEYAWFVFGPDRQRRTGQIEVLEITPAEQRRHGPARIDLGVA